MVASISGGIAGLAIGLFGEGKFAMLGGWVVAVIIYDVWLLRTIMPMDAATTRRHAIREEPGRPVADILLVVASVASIAAVVMLLAQATTDSGLAKALDIGLGLGSIILSWFMVHITYTLKYARQYYADKHGAVDFNEKTAPQYTDFAYLAFTLGMTFQVSDTNLQTKQIRATALNHALLSYLFGAVIIATTINSLASLSQ